MMNDELSRLLSAIRKTFAADFEPMDVDGRTLQVLTISNMPSHLDSLLQRGAIHDPLKDLPLWSKIWPGSFVLGRLLRKFQPEGKTLLEIGSGCGILGLIAAGYGFARITVSDNNENALLFAQANILQNGLQETVEAKFLDITAPQQSNGLAKDFDLIVASEILYLNDLHRPIIRYIDNHLKPTGKALFCTDMARLKPQFAKLAAKTFKFTEGHIGVKSTDEAGEEQRRVYSIYILERP